MAVVETPRSDRRAGRVSALWLVFGPTVWAVHFTILYLAHTLLCALAEPGASRVVTVVVLVATLAALVVLAVPLLRAWSPHRQPPSDPAAVSSFVRSASAWLTVLSAVAVIWAGATPLIVPACTWPQ